MKILAGTSGYAYKEWKGSFYPDKIAAAAMLAWYSGRFPTVEINNTFYRMPSESTLLKWTGEVGPEFLFVLKASQRITHQKRLKECDQELGYFLRTASILGAKLGPTLFQLPPNMKKDAARLEAFLALIPDRWRAAFEFRHASWFDDEVYALLRTRNAALVVSDTDEGDAPPVVATADWGYARLRRASYSDESLREWHARFATGNWTELFVFFKHEDEGTGPALAARFLELRAG